jgi:hypothetical protein
MGAWVTTWRVPPPTDRSILVRFGASVFAAAFSKRTGWEMVVPGGGGEKIEEPQLWWCSDPNAKSDPLPAAPSREPVTFRRSSRPKQLALGLNDSVSLSKRRAA